MKAGLLFEPYVYGWATVARIGNFEFIEPSPYFTAEKDKGIIPFAEFYCEMSDTMAEDFALRHMGCLDADV